MLPPGVLHMSALGRFGRLTLFSPRVSHSKHSPVFCFVLCFGFGGVCCFVVFLFPVLQVFGIPNSLLAGGMGVRRVSLSSDSDVSGIEEADSQVGPQRSAASSAASSEPDVEMDPGAQFLEAIACPQSDFTYELDGAFLPKDGPRQECFDNRFFCVLGDPGASYSGSNTLAYETTDQKGGGHLPLGGGKSSRLVHCPIRAQHIVQSTEKRVRHPAKGVSANPLCIHSPHSSSLISAGGTTVASKVSTKPQYCLASLVPSACVSWARCGS